MSKIVVSIIPTGDILTTDVKNYKNVLSIAREQIIDYTNFEQDYSCLNSKEVIEALAKTKHYENTFVTVEIKEGNWWE
ncbi:hypothetical protein D3C73_995400 [compost metagenome]